MFFSSTSLLWFVYNLQGKTDSKLIKITGNGLACHGTGASSSLLAVMNRGHGWMEVVACAWCDP